MCVCAGDVYWRLDILGATEEIYIVESEISMERENKKQLCSLLNFEKAFIILFLACSSHYGYLSCEYLFVCTGLCGTPEISQYKL